MTIPDWLEDHLNTNCPYCGAPIVNNSTLTDRYCSNPRCPEHMAQKIVVLAKRFGIKNFGIASAREAVRGGRIHDHLDIIPYWFKDERPPLYLYEIGEICLIKGHQKRWREYCAGCDSLVDLMQKPGLPQEIRDSLPMLVKASWYCRVRPRLTGKTMNVMLSGSFEGYRARRDFITSMNEKYGNTIQLVDVGKRRTGVDFLVKETYTTDHEKSAIAKECGIPVVTPKVLEESLAAFCSYINEGRNDA